MPLRCFELWQQIEPILRSAADKLPEGDSREAVAEWLKDWSALRGTGGTGVATGFVSVIRASASLDLLSEEGQKALDLMCKLGCDKFRAQDALFKELVNKHTGQFLHQISRTVTQEEFNLMDDLKQRCETMEHVYLARIRELESELADMKASEETE